VKESNLDIIAGDDYGDIVNISRRKMNSRFNDNSFHDTTSTPIKSPINWVSVL